MIEGKPIYDAILTDDNYVRGTEVKEQILPAIKHLVIQRIHDDAILPTYAKDGDSGMDVYATEDLILAPGEKGVCALGIKIAIPQHPLHNLGYRWELQARPRSGVSMKTFLRVSNSPATIDNTFRGEVKILVENADLPEYGVHETNVWAAGLHEDRVRAIDSVEVTKGHMDYARGINGMMVFTGNGSANVTGSILIRKGDRIAQLVFAEVIRPLEIIEGEVSEDTDRGADGLGSTGVNTHE